MILSDEQYERMMLLIFFETATIVMFLTLFNKITTDLYMFIFIYAVIFFQMPFVSFIQNDFMGRRPSLVKKITKIFINVLIFGVIFGIYVIIYLVDFKSGIVSTLVSIVFLIIYNRKKIENFLNLKKKTASKK